jgi:hypothetical protein
MDPRKFACNKIQIFLVLILDNLYESSIFRQLIAMHNVVQEHTKRYRYAHQQVEGTIQLLINTLNASKIALKQVHLIITSFDCGMMNWLVQASNH